jgi:hypothetical protein
VLTCSQSERAAARVKNPGGCHKGVVFVGDRKLKLRDFPDPVPGPRDVVLANLGWPCLNQVFETCRSD